MTVKEVTDILEQAAPLSWAEDFDNVGLLIGDKNMEVSGVLVSLDCLENVVQEAVEKQCNLIVSFHPIIFSGLKNITPSHYVDRVLIKAIKHDIAIYSMHTALDNAAKGVSYEMGKKLGIENMQPLLPNPKLLPKDPDGLLGMGRIGMLKTPVSEEDFMNMLQKTFGTPHLKHSAFLKKPITKVALLGGSGAFGIDAALLAGADAYVTADLKYHDYFKADHHLLLVDIGHYESEQFTKNILVRILTKKIANFAVSLSESNTNPIKYY
jgi:dinuclear metal center YbgI/SA1388 family protein